MNRMLSKTADPFFSQGACAGGACGATNVTYTYTATGQRASMTDASGTTSYSYDRLDRPIGKATPAGTLSYQRDLAGNQTSLTVQGISLASNVTYTYDADNRLATVVDGAGTTTYSYDAAGNLAGFTYPNGVATSYTYNALNRLTQMQSVCGTQTGCGAPGTAVASYAYTLGAAGNRLSVTELSGRSAIYTYDDLYRLTSETIAGAVSQNGAISYQYDAVGNRLQLTSTVGAIPSGLLNYDANDRLSTDVYDANGNTINNGGTANVYDFENRLVQRGGVKIVYDGDGSRVAETVAGVTTNYVVAELNPTGYVQVVEEVRAGVSQRGYTYGLERISQHIWVPSGAQGAAFVAVFSFYGYDGHGSVRYLTNSTGAKTDTYDYDAFGNLIASTGTTANNYLFAGEQFDPALGIYYNRARYYDQREGRFWTADTLEGSKDYPFSLHRYLYASANPINRIDPSGNFDFSIAGQTFTVSIQNVLTSIAINSLRGALFGGLFGATDALLGGKTGDQVLEEAAKGALIGAVLGPLAKIRFVAPVLVAFGTVAGVNGTLDSIDQGNYAQAAFRAAFAFLGFRTFASFAEPVPLEEPAPVQTGGRLGNATTRSQIAELAQNLNNRGWIITGGGGEQPEEYLPPTDGGRAGGNYVDITATKNGITLRVNTIDTLSDGVTPTMREAAAAALIRRKISPNDPFLLIPKDK